MCCYLLQVAPRQRSKAPQWLHSQTHGSTEASREKFLQHQVTRVSSQKNLMPSHVHTTIYALDYSTDCLAGCRTPKTKCGKSCESKHTVWTQTGHLNSNLTECTTETFIRTYVHTVIMCSVYWKYVQCYITQLTCRQSPHSGFRLAVFPA